MSYAMNRELRLHYEIHGEGRPVVLLHGATVSFEYNYAIHGWIQQLNASGLQVIGIDFRGHGKSDKPHDIKAYGTENLANDVKAVIQHLGLQRVSLIAYSIGTAVALHLLHDSPAQFDKAALIATGDGLIGISPHIFDTILPALALVLERTEYPRDLPKHLAAYWNFIQATAGDRAAMLALATASYPALSADDAASILTPTLIVSGECDPVLGRGSRLADALGNGEYLEIAGADHFSLAADAKTKSAVTRHLTQT